jgi:hypothetical protein
MLIDRLTMSFSPTVLHPLTLGGLLHHILTTQSVAASTTLIVCSSRDEFLQSLAQALEDDVPDGRLNDLVAPTLHNLFTSRHVKLAFCASVQTLLAYLTAYGGRDGNAPTAEEEKLARIFLVNPLALHASTMSFSAQGLSRSFAAAVEAALNTSSVLYLVECHTANANREHQNGDGDADMADENKQDVVDEQEQDPWEQELSILNVSARRFGSNSDDRAWAGRTVKAKTVAARWFRFQELENRETPEGQG